MTRVLNAIVIDAPQRSAQWFDARLGNVTGSKAKEVIRDVDGIDLKNVAIRKILNIYAVNAKVKDSEEYQDLLAKSGLELFKQAGLEIPESGARLMYRKTRVAERLTRMDASAGQFVSKAMQWGQANERLALAEYQLVTKNKVDEAFFLLHPELRCGASPDGHVTDTVTGELGVLEIKCLESHNHLYNIAMLQEVPEEYLVQCQMEMWLANVDFCDFVGYDSRLPGKLNIFIKRIQRDDNFIDNVLEPEIRAFLEQVDKDERYFRMMSRKGFEFNIDEFREVQKEEMAVVS